MKNDPTGKHHATVTKTTSQSNTELLTPSNLLAGLSGINRASNKSDSRAVGSGNSFSSQSHRKGVEGNTSLKPNSSGSQHVGS